MDGRACPGIGYDNLIRRLKRSDKVVAGMSIPIGPLTRGMLEIVKSTMLGESFFVMGELLLIKWD